MELLLSICVGVGLSAACGFRVFVPLLIMSIAANAGHLHLASSFAWIGSPIALVAFGLATILEVGAYYIPWLDHFLDALATPAAVIAGTIVTASMVTDVSPFLRWTLAVIAGGGVAGGVQATTVLARAFSFAGSGGLANPLVATLELGGSILTAVISLVAPFFALGLVVLLVGILTFKLFRRRSGGRIDRSDPPLVPQIG